MTTKSMKNVFVVLSLPKSDIHTSGQHPNCFTVSDQLCVGCCFLDPPLAKDFAMYRKSEWFEFIISIYMTNEICFRRGILTSLQPPFFVLQLHQDPSNA